jgi:hypothetical protein
VSFVANVAFTLVQGWGLWKQNETIRRQRSGESVAVLPFAYIGCVFLSLLCYGIAIRSLAVMVNGVLGVLQLRVLASLYRYKTFTRTERIAIACFPWMIPAMIALPWRGTVALAIMAGSLLPMVQQPYEIWRRRSAGAVDPRYLAIFLAAAVFGTIYAFAIANA